MFYWLPGDALKIVSESDVEIDGIAVKKAAPAGLNIDEFQKARDSGLLALLQFTTRRSGLQALHSAIAGVSAFPRAPIVSNAFAKWMLPDSHIREKIDNVRPQHVAAVLSFADSGVVAQMIDWALKTPAVRTLSVHFRNSEIDDEFAALATKQFVGKLPEVKATCHHKTHLRVTFTSEETPGIFAFHHRQSTIADLVIALDGYIPDEINRTDQTKVYVPEELRSLFGYVTPQLKHWTAALALVLPA